MLGIVREHLRETEDFRLETAASGFEAGIRAESFHPDCILVDLAIGRIEAGQIAQNLRRSPDHVGTVLVALTPTSLAKTCTIWASTTRSRSRLTPCFSGSGSVG